jgi:hypothetical protein
MNNETITRSTQWTPKSSTSKLSEVELLKRVKRWALKMVKLWQSLIKEVFNVWSCSCFMWWMYASRYPPMMWEKILNHTKLLNGIFIDQFANYTNIKINLPLLCETVESCFYDIYRLKFFRNIRQEYNINNLCFLWFGLRRCVRSNLKQGQL